MWRSGDIRGPSRRHGLRALRGVPGRRRRDEQQRRVPYASDEGYSTKSRSPTWIGHARRTRERQIWPRSGRTPNIGAAQQGTWDKGESVFSAGRGSNGLTTLAQSPATLDDTSGVRERLSVGP